MMRSNRQRKERWQQRVGLVFKGIDATKVRRCRLREVCMHTVGMTAVTGVCKIPSAD